MKLSIASLAPFLLASTCSAFSMSMQLPGSNLSPGVVSKTSEWEINKISPVQRVEGMTRHAFSFNDSSKDVVQVAMTSPVARPVDAEVNLWLGPDYTPYQLKCHTEDGKLFPIQTLVGTKGVPVNVEVKNVGKASYPLMTACSYAISPLAESPKAIQYRDQIYIEGGAVKMFPFAPEVDQIQVLLRSQGKQLKAKIELLNGPNNVKQEFEVYSSNGEKNYLFLVFETPGQGNAIRVKNLATQEYPLDLYFRSSKTGKVENDSLEWN
jgi:hypothetical protein